MEVIRLIEPARKVINSAKEDKRKIGFVPTMGALHIGHISLIKKAKKENDFVAVSIFVNPLQFSQGEDYHRYPSDNEGDILKLKNEGVDLLFLPDPQEIYSNQLAYVQVSDLSERLCGKFRPGHFKGVATVVLKLFNIITPIRAYFGNKDYQQLVIIKKMVKDFNLNLNIIGVETVRDEKGLAFSSRNTYLDSDAYSKALLIPASINMAKEMVKMGQSSSQIILKTIYDQFEKNDIKIDYISICNPETLEDEAVVKPGSRIFFAVRVGNTRLIDNDVLE